MHNVSTHFQGIKKIVVDIIKVADKKREHEVLSHAEKKF
jgi:hypothetical protein